MRTGQLARYGWAAVLRDLGKGREWAGDGQLRINRFGRPTRVLSPRGDRDECANGVSSAVTGYYS